jgi:hypothetical protein
MLPLSLLGLLFAYFDIFLNGWPRVWLLKLKFGAGLA